MKTEDVAIEVYTRQSLPTSRDVMTMLYRQRRVMLITFAVVLVAVAVSGLWVPKYETQMKVLVRRQRSDEIVTSSANAPTVQFNDQVSEQDLNSEVELLNSEDLLRKVVLSTGLAGVQGPATDRDSKIKVAKGGAPIKQGFEDWSPASEQSDLRELRIAESGAGGESAFRARFRIYGKAPGGAPLGRRIQVLRPADEAIRAGIGSGAKQS